MKPKSEEKLVTRLLAGSAGFPHLSSNFRYSLDTIGAPSVPRTRTFIRNCAIPRGCHPERSEGSQLFALQMESPLSGNWFWLECWMAYGKKCSVQNKKGGHTGRPSSNREETAAPRRYFFSSAGFSAGAGVGVAAGVAAGAGAGCCEPEDDWSCAIATLPAISTATGKTLHFIQVNFMSFSSIFV